MITRKSTFLNRSLALLIAATLCLDSKAGWTQLQAPAPAVGDAVARTLPDLRLQDFPKELGSITEVFQAPETRTPRVILVQDAHSVAAAQQSIQKLVDYFETRAGLNWIALEGSGQRLDPLLLRTYPEKKILEGVMSSYVGAGEISGAAAAAVLGSGRAVFEGIEDNGLYEADITAYLESLQQRPSAEARLKEIRGRFEELRSAWYPAGIVELEKKRESFERGHGDLFDYLLALEKFRAKMPADFSETHPLLASLLALTHENSGDTRRQMHLEIRALAEGLEKKLSSHRERADFFREKQAYETEQKAPEEFLFYLLNAHARTESRMAVSPLLKKKVSDYLKIQRAAGEDLNRELQSALRLVKQSELRSPLDRRLDQAAQKLFLLEKILSLELHAGEWKTLLESRQEAEFQKAPGGEGEGEEQIEALEAGIRSAQNELLTGDRPWIRFYEKADAREQKMWEKFARRLGKSSGAVPVMVVTGGFHREGLAERLRRSGISYWIVTPAVMTLPDESVYENQMRGEVSWKKHFTAKEGRVNVYEAFHRDAFGRLARAYEEAHGSVSSRALMRQWRENILRALAASDRLHEAWRYTAFLDEASLQLLESQGRDAAGEAWEKRLKHFLERAEHLKSEGRLGADALADLFARPAATGWTAVKILSSAETVPAAWLDPRPELKGAAEPAVEPAAETQGSVQEVPAREPEKKQPVKTVPANLNLSALSPAAGVPAGFAAVLGEILFQSRHRSELRSLPEDDAWRAAAAEAVLKPQLEKLKIAVNLKDAGAYYRDGVLSYENSFAKLKKLLPVLRAQGVGSIYLYGGLYDMGGISSRLHRGRPDGRAEYISENNGRTMVKIENYATKKTAYEIPGQADPLIVEDGHNPFSIHSLLQFNPHLSSDGSNWGTEARTHEQLRELIRSAHELGMKATLDFIPWMAPDAIDETNYRWTFYKELPDAENERFRLLPEEGEGETKELFLKKKIDENPSYFTVRIREPGREERVVLVRHLVSDMGGFNVDQAVLNPFLPAVREYYRQALERLVDAGADEVRVDLGHVYLREYIADPARGYFSDAYWSALPADLRADLEKALREIDEPWKAVLAGGKQYAQEQGRELTYVMEAYDQRHLTMLRDLGADKTYYADVFKNLVRVARGEPAHFLEAALRHAVGNRGSLVAFPSNFDQFPLRSIKGAQNAARALLLMMPELQLDVMWDLRDWIGFSGQVFPMVGGDQDPAKESDHTFADQKEFETTTNPEAFYEAVRSSETAVMLSSLLTAVKTRRERYIEFLDNARRDRFTTLAWQTEDGDDWRILALNFKPAESETAGFIELPRRALIHAGARGFKAVDAESGEELPIDGEFRLNNVRVPAEKQYRIIRLFREETDKALEVSAKTRSELRAETADLTGSEDGERLRRKLFHERILDQETKELLISLLPRPLIDHVLSGRLDEIPWVNLGDPVDSPGQLVYRVSFQDPDIVVFSLSQAMPGPRGLSQEAVVYLPLQDLGGGYLGLLQHGRLQKLEISAPRTDAEKAYLQNPFAYWLENNLDAAARRLGVEGTLLTPLMLNPDQLLKLGFRKTRDEAFWYRPTGGAGARSELRSTPVVTQASVFGRGAALTEDYSIEGDTMTEEVFQTLFAALQRRVQKAGSAAERAREILDHLKKTHEAKRISIFQEQRWSRNSYITGAAGADSLLFGSGFLAVPDLAEEAFFRLAEISFDLAHPDKAAGHTADLLYQPEEQFRTAHQDFVELKDEAVLRAAVRSFNGFSPGSPNADTRVLFENWARADISAARKGKERAQYPVLEQAAYLASALSARGWNRLPEDAEDYEQVLADDPDRAKAFFEIVYPLYVFGFYRYQFLSHARVLQQIYMKGIRKTVEDIDSQLREVLLGNKEVMRGGVLRNRQVIDYLSGAGYRFSNDAGISEDLINSAPKVLIADYQKNISTPARYREANTSVIESIVWDFYQKTLLSGKHELHPAWHLYADITISGEPSAAQFKKAAEKYHELAYEILKAPRAWQEEWLDDRIDRREGVASAQRKIPVPGHENAVVDDIGRVARSASGYRWKNLIPQLHNDFSPDSDAFLASLNPSLSFRQERLEYLTVSGMPAAPFWQTGRRMRYHLVPPAGDSSKDRLVVLRDEALFWSQVYVWTTPQTGRSHSADVELPLVLPLIGAVRRSLLKKETPAGEFNFNGVDVHSWIRSIMALHDFAETRFWTMVGDAYPSYAEFFNEERTPWTEQKMFWYYSLMRHPKGLFAEMASQIKYIPGTRRLTPESAAFVLDAVYAIYWGGPQRLLPVEGNRWMLGSLLHYFHMHPDGVSVPDPEGLRAFLTDDLAPEGTVLDEKDFTEWLQKSSARNRLFSDKDALVETMELKNPEPGSAYAQIRPVLNSDDDIAFDPENFPAQNLLRAEALPWPSLAAREAVWTGIYKNGIAVPGSRFRYRFPSGRVEDGTVLTVRVTPPQGESRGTFEIINEAAAEGGEILVRQSLPEAREERYARGREKGQDWEKIPDPARIAEGVQQGAFEEISIRESGFLIFQHEDRQAALHLPSLYGRDAQKLLIQREGSGAAFFTMEGDYLGHVSFGQAARQAVSSTDRIKVLAPFPVPVEAPEFNSLSDYTNLLALAAELKPLMMTGRGYDRIVVTGRREGDAGIDNRMFILPGRMLEDVSSAVGAIRELLAKSDPSYRLQLLYEKLDRDEKAGSHFERGYVFPEVPGLEPFGEGWVESTYAAYKSLDLRVREKLRTMRALRALDRFRSSHEEDLGPHWSRPGYFRRFAEALLKRTDTAFHFQAKGVEFNSLKGLTDMEYQHADSARRRNHDFTPFTGIGVATAEHFRIQGGELTLSKNPNPDPQKYFFIRVLHEGKPAVHIFSMDTGEKVEEAEHRHHELEAKLTEAQVALSDALAAASGKGGLLHLNRAAHDLEDFMARIKTGDETADLELKLELTGKLQQLLPPLIRSDYSEINTAAVSLILREILAEGPGAAADRLDRFQKEFSRRADEPTFYLHALLDLYHESFALSPENRGENYEERFYDFFDGAFLPAALEYSSQTGFSQFVHADSYYQGAIDILSESKRGLSERIAAYLDRAPAALRGRDVLALMHGFEVEYAARGTIKPWESYFIRKNFRETAAREKQITDEEARERATYITAYGGVEGIGASSALIEYRGRGQSETDAVITDAGIKIDSQNTPPVWPDEFSVKPKAVFLTHAHLDHVGAAIDLWEKLGRSVPFYVTPGTADILGRVLEFANVSGREAEGPARTRDPAAVDAFMKSVRVLKLNRWYAVSPKMKVYFHGPVGHLHGAASLVISTPDGNTFLSGDVSIRAQGPVPAFAPLPPEIAAQIDQALVESTYGMLRRTPEEQQEARLTAAVAERLNEGGRVLIPAFANGRAQRVLLLLLQHLEKLRGGVSDFRIYIDGQAAVFTALYLKAYPEVFAPYREQIQRHVVLIQSDDPQVRGRLRSELEERDGNQRTVIIASAGNASQGRSRYWATRLANDPKSGIFFTGYMDPQEMGSQLLRAAQEGQTNFYFGSDLGFLPLLAKIAEFKLAGHASGEEIFKNVLEPIGESLRQLWIGHGGHAQSREVIEHIRGERPEWNPVLLHKLDRAQGAVPMTYSGLEARREFFESLSAELLYEPVISESPVVIPESGPVIPVESAPDHPGVIVEDSLRQEDITAALEATVTETAVPAVEEESGVPAEDLELTLEKERFTKESRQALLEIRLRAVPELKASEAVTWMKEEAVRRGFPEKAGTFGESTLRADLKEIRNRSELREIADPVLMPLALGGTKTPEQSRLEAFAGWFNRERTARVLVQEYALDHPRYKAAAAGFSFDEQALLSKLETERAFQRRHPKADQDLESFVTALFQTESEQAQRALDSAPEAPLHYSFAFPLEGSARVQTWFLEYARMIQGIKNRYPGRVTADLRLLVTKEESLDPERREFFRALARTGVARVLEISDPSAAALQLKRFTEDGKNKNALVYGSENLPLEGVSANRRVRSGVDSETAFPVAVLLTRKLSQVSGAVPAELLGQLTRELPQGMLTFNGTSLEITTLAMELMYRFQADRRIQTAA